MQILELTLQTNNLPDTKDFYQQTMGFELIHETDNSIYFSVGTSILIFELIESEQCPKYHFAFNIPINKIPEAIDWTLERTNLIATDDSFVTDFDNWKATAIYFLDNNRNIVEFICRTDLNNPTELPFSVDTILNINEIGLVTHQSLQTGEEIIEKINTTFFEKGPIRDDFAAVGTDQGLFVISNPYRNWYPTQEKAEIWKVKGKIRMGELEYDLEFN